MNATKPHENRSAEGARIAVGTLALAYITEVEGGPFPQCAVAAPALADLRALLAALEASRADALRLAEAARSVSLLWEAWAQESEYLREPLRRSVEMRVEECRAALSAHRALNGGAL